MLGAKCQKAESDVTNLKTSLEESSESIDSLKEQLKDLRKRADDAVTSQQQKYKKLQDEKEKIEVEKEKLKAEKNLRQNAFDDVVAETRAALPTEQLKVKGLQGELNTAKSRSQTQQEQIGVQQNEILGLREQLAGEISKHEATKATFVEPSPSVQEVEMVDGDDYSYGNGAQHGEMDGLREQDDRKRASDLSLQQQQQLRNLQAECSGLRQELDRERNEHEVTRNVLPTPSLHAPNVEMTDADGSDGSIVRQRSEMTNAGGSANTPNMNVVEKLNGDIIQLQEQSHTLSQRLNTLRSNFDDVTAARDGLTSRVVALRGEVETAAQQLATAKTNEEFVLGGLSKETKKRKQYQILNDQLETELEQQRSLIASYNVVKRGLELRNGRLRAVNEQYYNTMIEMRSQGMPVPESQISSAIPAREKDVMDVPESLCKKLEQMEARNKERSTGALSGVSSSRTRPQTSQSYLPTRMNTRDNMASSNMGDSLGSVKGNARIGKHPKKPSKKPTTAATVFQMEAEISSNKYMVCRNADRFSATFGSCVQNHEKEKHKWNNVDTERIRILMVGDKEHDELAEVYQQGESNKLRRPALRGSGYVGTMIFSSNHSRITYFSDHDEPSHMTRAMVSLKEFFEGGEPALLPEFIPSDIDQEEVIEFAPYIKEHAMMCLLVQFPEVQYEAAMKCLSGNALHRYKKKFEGTRGECRACEEKRSMPALWEKAVQKLTDLPSFKNACVSWGNGKLAESTYCWSSTFHDPKTKWYYTALYPDRERAGMQDEDIKMPTDEMDDLSEWMSKTDAADGSVDALTSIANFASSQY